MVATLANTPDQAGATVGDAAIRRSRRRDFLRKWDTRIALLLALATAALFLPVRPPHSMTRNPVPPESASVAIVVGPGYRAGPLHRWLLGPGYREMWNQPVRVQVLDLRGFAGGLRPLRTGGGMQTLALHFASAGGRQFVFRSIDKNPTQVLRPILRHTLIADLVQDQTSAELPAAPLVVAPLLDAVGVPHANPVLVVLPDDSLLGEFRAVFAGLPGMLEEYPVGRTGSQLRGLDSDSVIDGQELLWRLDAGPDNQVGARGFLTARLMDLFFNDWDRHQGQWRWQRRVSGKDTVWSPLPRDRDQAFVSYDGLLLDLARLVEPKLVKFGSAYPRLVGLMHNSRDIDARFLAGLDRRVWDSTAAFLVARLTDSVIDLAVGRIPEAHRRLSGPVLASLLKQRRNRLPQIATEFYGELASRVELHATDAAELVQIVHASDGSVVVRLSPRSGDGARPFVDRKFDPDETREIRFFLRGGDDRVEVSGEGTSPIRLRRFEARTPTVSPDSLRIPPRPAADRAPPGSPAGGHPQ